MIILILIILINIVPGHQFASNLSDFTDRYYDHASVHVHLHPDNLPIYQHISTYINIVPGHHFASNLSDFTDRYYDHPDIYMSSYINIVPGHHFASNLSDFTDR